MVAAIELKSIEHILLDIEGTVSDVRFVYDVMFPYAKQSMSEFLRRSWQSPEVQAGVRQVAEDAGNASSEWQLSDGDAGISQLSAHLQELMSTDSKATGLKSLQGLVWKEGFESGNLTAELFPDVLPAMKDWVAAGKKISIYSSGSVLAQKLFFGYTTQGDLTGMLSRYFDTTTGKKQDPQSYGKIAKELGLDPSKILFASDVTEELVAAQQVGMQVVASVREGNKPLAASYVGPQVASFADVH